MFCIFRGEPNKSDLTGFTALHHACKNGHENIVHYLVNFGCNIWALDNDFHTSLDIANINDKREIAQLLDMTHSKQETKNPKVVQGLKEKAVRDAEYNIKKYEKLQKEVDRYIKKQEKRAEGMNDFKAPTKNNIFKTLTMKIKGTQRLSNHKKFIQNSSSSNFSDLAIGTSKRGIAKKIAMKQISHEGGGAFETKDFGTSGKRTLSKLAPGTTVVQGSASDVMYLTNRENDIQGARPALANVFSGLNSIQKWKSDSNLLDEYDNTNDMEDDEQKPGIFNRPALGQISFLRTNAGMAGTFSGMGKGFKSASADELDSVDFRVNGFQNGFHNGEDRSSDENEDLIEQSNMHMQDVPWQADDLIDDDDDATPLVRFLESCDLSRYLHLFTKEDIDLSKLSLLTDKDLAELGLLMGPRRAIQDALKQRRDVLSQPRPIVDSYL